MALIVETGTGLANAESYASVAEADAYHTLRGNTTWYANTPLPLLDVEKEAALRRATDYMQQAYFGRWKGYRLTSTQVLDFPRVGIVFPNDNIVVPAFPLAIKNACIELAWRAAAGDLLADFAPSDNIIREKIGPLETEYSKVSSTCVKYQAVDALLRLFVTDSGSSVNVGLKRA